MLARRERFVALVVRERLELGQQPDPSLVEFLLDVDASHLAGLADGGRGPIVALRAVVR